MRTTPTPPSACPGCKRPLQAASSAGNSVPEPGDFSVCFDCGQILRFAQDLTATAAAESELSLLEPAKRALLSSWRARIKRTYPGV